MAKRLVRDMTRHLTEEHKRKISEARRGVPMSEETKQKISSSLTGRSHSDDTKRRISTSRNTTGFYRVHLIKRKGVYKDSIRYGYTYFDENHVRRLISASTLAKLKSKVQLKGLDWFIIDEKKANELLMKDV